VREPIARAALFVTAYVRRTALLAPWIVFAIDAFFRRRKPPLLIDGLLDESAHAATDAVLLGALAGRRTAGLLPGSLLGAVLLDLDHVPVLLGRRWLTRPGMLRPYPHALASAAVPAAAAALAPRRYRGVLLAAAFGVLTHLLRDMATGGLALYWPVSRRRVAIPYPAYAALLLAAAAVAARRRPSKVNRRTP
jgi:inner membrane protein